MVTTHSKAAAKKPVKQVKKVKKEKAAPVKKLSLIKELCAFFEIKNIHGLSGHSVLITTQSGFEISYRIEIINHSPKLENGEIAVLIIPQGMQFILLQKETLSLHYLSARGPESGMYIGVPFKEITFFYLEKCYTCRYED